MELKVNTKGQAIEFNENGDFKLTKMILYPKVESLSDTWFIIKAISETGVLHVPGKGEEIDIQMEKYREGEAR
jgi:hypothetical protein